MPAEPLEGGDVSDEVTNVHLKLLLGAVEGLRTDFKPVSDLVTRHDERIDALTRRQDELSARLSTSLEWFIKNHVVVQQRGQPEIEKKHVAIGAGLGMALTAIAEILRLVITT